MTDVAANANLVTLKRPKRMFGPFRRTLKQVPTTFDVWITSITITSRGYGTGAEWNTANYLTSASTWSAESCADTAKRIHAIANFGREDQAARRDATYYNASAQRGNHTAVPKMDQIYYDDPSDSTTGNNNIVINIQPRDQCRIVAQGVLSLGYSVSLHIDDYLPYVSVVFPRYQDDVDGLHELQLRHMLDELLHPSKTNKANYVHSFEPFITKKTYGFVPDKKDPFKRRRYSVWKIFVRSVEKRYKNKLLELLGTIGVETWEHEDVTHKIHFSQSAKFHECSWTHVFKWHEPETFFTTTQIEVQCSINDVLAAPEDAPCQSRAMPPMVMAAVDIEQYRAPSSDPKTIPKPGLRVCQTDPLYLKDTKGHYIRHAGFPTPDEKGDAVICISVDTYRTGNFDNLNGRRVLEDDFDAIAKLTSTRACPHGHAQQSLCSTCLNAVCQHSKAVKTCAQCCPYYMVDDVTIADKNEPENPYYERYRALPWIKELLNARSDPNDPEAVLAFMRANANKKQTLIDRLKKEVDIHDVIVLLEDADETILSQHKLFDQHIVNAAKATTSGSCKAFMQNASQCLHTVADANLDVSSFDLEGKDVTADIRPILERMKMRCPKHVSDMQASFNKACATESSRFKELTTEDFVLTKEEVQKRRLVLPRTMGVFGGCQNMRRQTFLFDPELEQSLGVKRAKIACRPLYKSALNKQDPAGGWNLVHVYASELEAIMGFHDFYLHTHPDVVYAHNSRLYDWPTLFRRVNELSGDKMVLVNYSNKPIKHPSRNMQPLPRGVYENNNTVPKTPYAYTDRYIFTKCSFVRKVAASEQLGASEAYYFNVTGFADNDTYQIYKNDVKKHESYTLDNLAYETLQDHKMSIGIPRMNACFRVRYFWPIIAYCEDDALLTAGMMQSGGKTNFIASVAETVHMSMDDVGKYGVSRLIFALFCRIAASLGFSIEKDIPVSPKTVEGAKVFDPFAQILGYGVTTLDYQALYPSEIQAHNLCVTSVMRPLNRDLDPIQFDWSKPAQCAQQLREWDVVRKEVYGEPFMPSKFADLSKSEQDTFKFLYPMSSSISIRVNQNADPDDYLGPFIKPSEEKKEDGFGDGKKSKEKKQTKNVQQTMVRDVAPVVDFLIDRPQFYNDGVHKPVEEAKGIIVIMLDLLLGKRAAVRKRQDALKEAHYDKVTETWDSNEARCLYKALDGDQLASKLFCNGTYGWMAMVNGKVTYSFPAFATTYFARLTIKFSAIMVLAGWIPTPEDFVFMQEQFQLIKENVDTFPYSVKDAAKLLLSRGMPASPEEGDQTKDVGWCLPKTEIEFDKLLKTLKSRWGISVVYGDTDSIMVAIWFVLCVKPNAEGRRWFDRTTRAGLIKITKHQAAFITDIHKRFDMNTIILKWEKIIEPYVGTVSKKLYSGYLYENPDYFNELILKSMKKRDIPRYILVILKRCMRYMSEDLCGVRVVPYVKRTMLAIARSGGKLSFPGLLNICIRNQGMNKDDYENNIPSQVLANRRVAKRFPGYQHGPNERVDWVAAYRPEKHVAKSDKGVTVREIELMIEEAEMAGTGEDELDVDNLRIPEFGGRPLRLDLEDLFEKLKKPLGKIFETCLKSEYSLDYKLIINSPMAVIRLSDGRKVEREDLDAVRMADNMRRIFEYKVTDPRTQLSHIFQRAPAGVAAIPLTASSSHVAMDVDVPITITKKREGSPFTLMQTGSTVAPPAPKKVSKVALPKLPPMRPIGDFFGKKPAAQEDEPK